MPRPLLLSLGALAGAGLLLFAAGAAAMLLAEGRPMSREELEELERRMLRLERPPDAAGRTAGRLPKLAKGAEVEQTSTFSEVKTAFRARAWQVSAHWRRFFVLMLGALLTLFGLFACAVVLAPPGAKLLFAGALLYAAIRLAWGFARA